jgi:hypothetical protein
VGLICVLLFLRFMCFRRLFAGHRRSWRQRLAEVESELEL